MTTYNVFTAPAIAGIPAHRFVAQVHTMTELAALQVAAKTLGIESSYFATTLFEAQREDDPRSHGQAYATEAECRELVRRYA